MKYLLDTNSWIHYLKNPSSKIEVKLKSLSPSDVATCSIVVSELLHGAEKYGNTKKRVALVYTTLAPFVSLPFDDQDAATYAKLRDSLEKAGNIIGPYDLQIAAICLRHGLTVVTNNVGEFSRVSGLPVEDWQ